MAVNADVEKKGNESASSLIRRFTKKVQGSGVLKKVRSVRYDSRNLSKTMRRKQALKKLRKREERDRLYKLGKTPS